MWNTFLPIARKDPGSRHRLRVAAHDDRELAGGARSVPPLTARHIRDAAVASCSASRARHERIDRAHAGPMCPPAQVDDARSPR